MKLRPKSQIDAQVASQRKAQIDEGVRIAQKVDALRETLSMLEAQHEQYIAGMKGELDRQTSDRVQRIAELESEIRELEEKRKLLLAPLDEAWAEVRTEKQKVQVLIENLGKSSAKSEATEAKRLEKLKEAKETLGRIKIRERELLKVYTQAEADRQDAEKIRVNLESDRTSQEALFEKRSAGLDAKEKQLQEDEKAVLHQKEINQIRESALNDRERGIEDRYQTLLRTENRLKK